jgi:hypothetical protein
MKPVRVVEFVSFVCPIVVICSLIVSNSSNSFTLDLWVKNSMEKAESIHAWAMGNSGTKYYRFQQNVYSHKQQLKGYVITNNKQKLYENNIEIGYVYDLTQQTIEKKYGKDYLILLETINFVL